MSDDQVIVSAKELEGFAQTLQSQTQVIRNAVQYLEEELRGLSRWQDQNKVAFQRAVASAAQELEPFYAESNKMVAYLDDLAAQAARIAGSQYR